MVKWTEAEYKQYVSKRINSYSKAATQKKVVVKGGYTSNWSGKVKIGKTEHFYRSLWEYNFACYLEYCKNQKQIKDWKYEPTRYCFKNYYKRGPYDYLPDFIVTNVDGSTTVYEVKGYMNSISRSKIKRFEKHYPELGIVSIIDKDWFKNSKSYAGVIPGWSSLSTICLKC
jgi:hypothetical protein